MYTRNYSPTAEAMVYEWTCDGCGAHKRRVAKNSELSKHPRRCTPAGWSCSDDSVALCVPCTLTQTLAVALIP